MRGALAILAGLVLGVVAAGLLLGGIVAFAPDPVPPAAPAPSVAVVLPTVAYVHRISVEEEAMRRVLGTRLAGLAARD